MNSDMRVVHFQNVSGYKSVFPNEKNAWALAHLLEYLLTEVSVARKKYDIEIFILALCSLLLILWQKAQLPVNVHCKTTPVPQSVFELATSGFDEARAESCIETVSKYHYDVNYWLPNKTLSLFLCACLSGSVKLIIFMIKQGADVTSVSAYGDSALYLAAYGYLNSPKPDLRIISILISSGCDINQANNSGFTTLHQAAARGNLLLTEYLIFRGADPNIHNHNGVLPLHVAFQRGHYEVIEFLIHQMEPITKKQASSVYNF